MRRFLPVLLLAAVMVFAVPGAAFAKDIWVTVDGTGNGLTQDSPLGNIETAIGIASSYDVVRVASGEYREGTHFTGSIDINKWISLQGEGPDTTTLVRSGGGSVISINAFKVQVSGFTITGGGNKNSTYGGGINMINCGTETVISDNIITGNVSLYGGGIYCGAGNPTISKNVIAGNSAEGSGGGMFCTAASGLESTPRIVNNVITDNTAGPRYGGGAIAANENAYPWIINCTIVGNTGGIYSGYYCAPNVANCIFWNNEVAGKPVLVNLYGPMGRVSSNITTNPGFVDGAAGDYELTIDSPAVNTGASAPSGFPISFMPTTDMLGASRPQGAGIDKGAYERLATPHTVPVAQGAVTVTFPAAVASGQTTATKTPLGESTPAPTGKRLLGDAHYDITTTADRVAPMEVTVTLGFDDTGLSATEKASARLYHYTGGSWVDITTGQPNLVNKTVSGVTTSFSPFGVFYTQDAPVAPGDEPISTPASSAWSIVLLALVATAYLAFHRRSEA